MKVIDTEGRPVLAAQAKTAYGPSTAITCTLAGLLNNAAWQSTAVDNGNNKYLDAMLFLGIGIENAPSGDKAVYVWFYGSEDAVRYTDNASGTNGSITLRSPSNLRGPFVISTPELGSGGSALTYNAVIGSVAAFFGGVLPRKWGIVVQNKTGA